MFMMLQSSVKFLLLLSSLAATGVAPLSSCYSSKSSTSVLARTTTCPTAASAACMLLVEVTEYYSPEFSFGGVRTSSNRYAFECVGQCMTDSRGDTIVKFSNLSCPSNSNQGNVNSNQGNGAGAVALSGYFLYMLGAISPPLFWLSLVPLGLSGRLAESERYTYTLYSGCTGTVVKQTLYCCLADNCNSVNLLKNGSDFWGQPSKLLLLLMLVVSQI